MMRARILRSDSARLVVAVNLAYFSARFIDPRLPKIPVSKEGISFNTGYFYKGRSLGRQWFNGTEYGQFHGKGPRPTLSLDGIRTEAGPTIILDGRNVLVTSIRQGGFKADVAGKTRHAVTGWAGDMLILGYYEDADLATIAKEMPEIVRKEGMKLDWLMNCDGGSSAHLNFLGDVRGRKEPVVGIELVWKD